MRGAGAGGGAVVVMCPLEVERKAVAAAIARAGFADNPRVRVVRTGMGAGAAAGAVSSNAASAGFLVLAGVGGGLAETAGVVVSQDIIDDTGETWPCRAGLVHAGDLPRVTIVGVDEIIASPADKQALYERTGAVVVDMESHGFVRTCEERSKPWLVVRAISDGPDELFPSEIGGWIDPKGRTRTGRVVIDLARKPSLLPVILRIARRSKVALRELGDAVAAVVGRYLQAPAAPHITPEPAAEQTPLPPSLLLAVRAGAVRTVIVFGGSFDPVTRAHTDLPEHARRSLETAGHGPARLLYIPAAKSPLKQQGPVASDNDRLAMLRIALRERSQSDIWTDELDRVSHQPASASYTIDTLVRLRERLDAAGGSAVELRLLIGADQAAAFHRWRDFRRVIELAEPLVMVRGDAGQAEIEHALRTAGAWTPQQVHAWLSRLTDVPPCDTSSTRVRELLATSPHDRAALLALLDPEVLAYLERARLYSGHAGR